MIIIKSNLSLINFTDHTDISKLRLIKFWPSIQKSQCAPPPSDLAENSHALTINAVITKNVSRIYQCVIKTKFLQSKHRKLISSEYRLKLTNSKFKL